MVDPFVLWLSLLPDESGAYQSSLNMAARRLTKNFFDGLLQKVASDATTMGLDQCFYGQAGPGASFLQGIGLFALTAVSAFTIAHLPILDQIWNSGGVQLVQGDQSTTVSLQNELLKPALEGGAAYGIGDLLGIKDSQALGIGTAVGSFAAPWISAGVDQFYGGQLPQGPALYTNNSFTSFTVVPTGGNVALSVASQIDGLIGGLASYAYNGDFSLGQFGAIQVYNFNDILARWRSNNGGKEYEANFSDPRDLVLDFGSFQQAQAGLGNLGINDFGSASWLSVTSGQGITQTLTSDGVSFTSIPVYGSNGLVGYNQIQTDQFGNVTLSNYLADTNTASDTWSAGRLVVQGSQVNPGWIDPSLGSMPVNSQANAGLLGLSLASVYSNWDPSSAPTGETVYQSSLAQQQQAVYQQLGVTSGQALYVGNQLSIMGGGLTKAAVGAISFAGSSGLSAVPSGAVFVNGLFDIATASNNLIDNKSEPTLTQWAVNNTVTDPAARQLANFVVDTALTGIAFEGVKFSGGFEPGALTEVELPAIAKPTLAMGTGPVYDLELNPETGVYEVSGNSALNSQSTALVRYSGFTPGSTLSSTAPESNLSIWLGATTPQNAGAILSVQGSSGISVGDFLSQAQNLSATAKAEAGGVELFGMANWGSGAVSPEVYKMSLQTQLTPTSTVQNLYEIANTGPNNYLIQGGGEEFWVDGIQGTTVQEVKYVSNPSNSPFIANSAIPNFIQARINAQVDNEFYRMSQIIQDPNNPLTDVEVITNNPDANQYFINLMKTYNLNGRIINR